MTGLAPRVAGAPITWGVCEVPDWGCQLGRDRVLEEAAGLGLRAIELGPQGFLPNEPHLVKRALEPYDLTLVAGFVPAVLHRRGVQDEVLQATAAAVDTLAGAGATVLVLAAELGNGGYERSAELSEPEWAVLLDGLERVREVAAGRGLEVALHPHHGTAIERPHHVERVLSGSAISLCLDTGHLMVGGADPVEVTRAAKGRIAHVHLKDVNASLSEQVRRGEVGYRQAVAGGLYRPLGEGDAGIDRVLALLEGWGYAGWYVLEQDVVLSREPPAGAGPVVSARRSLDYFHRVMGACRSSTS
ncbi:MAG TPA: TIM barrel protein [Gemmatimonadales bacterium]|nr:TIM barrel protein [Gemmatimonadales bacterium]